MPRGKKQEIVFKRAADALRGIHEIGPEQERRVVKRYKMTERRAKMFKDREMLHHHSRDVKRRQREGLLDARVPTRECPVCAGFKERSRQWVVFDAILLAKETSDEAKRARCKGAVCRGCAMKHFRIQLFTT